MKLEVLSRVGKPLAQSGATGQSIAAGITTVSTGLTAFYGSQFLFNVGRAAINLDYPTLSHYADKVGGSIVGTLAVSMAFSKLSKLLKKPSKEADAQTPSKD